MPAIDEALLERIKSAPPGMLRDKVITLLSASRDAWREYRETRKASALKDAQEAERVLDELLPQLFPEDAVGPSLPDAGERFRTRKAAFEWLQQQGVGVSRAKFYEDCSAGLLLLYPDKTVSKASVYRYRDKLLGDLPGYSRDDLNDDLELDRLKAENLKKVNRRLDLQIENMEQANRVNDRRWMLREDAWASLVGVLHMLRQNLDYHLHQAAAMLVSAVEGNVEFAPQLVDQALAHVVNPAFNDLSGRALEHACFAGLPGEGGDNEEPVEEEESHP